MGDMKRRLFVGGPLHGQVLTVRAEEHGVTTIDRQGDVFDTAYSLVTYYSKAFGPEDCRMAVFVMGTQTAGTILAALATLAGVDYEIGERK
jgi:hypothetical protein